MSAAVASSLAAVAVAVERCFVSHHGFKAGALSRPPPIRVCVAR